RPRRPVDGCSRSLRAQGIHLHQRTRRESVSACREPARLHGSGPAPRQPDWLRDPRALVRRREGLRVATWSPQSSVGVTSGSAGTGNGFRENRSEPVQHPRDAEWCLVGQRRGEFFGNDGVVTALDRIEGLEQLVLLKLILGHEALVSEWVGYEQDVRVQLVDVLLAQGKIVRGKLVGLLGQGEA